jgi:chromatin assembly factor 1 subunit B
MKIELPEIFWHGDRERIMSLDFSPSSLLVTAGADLSTNIYIRLWQVSFSPEFRIQHMDDLAGTHERSVNVVRFSPCRGLIASGSDDCCVVIWEKKKKPVFGEDRFELGWGSKKVLRGHLREVHDLAWSPSGKSLASGGLDS